jgi:hypothetical protein
MPVKTRIFLPPPRPAKPFYTIAGTTPFQEAVIVFNAEGAKAAEKR